MVQKEEWAERRLEELRTIVHDFNHIVTSYIDCFEAIAGTFAESAYVGDTNKETVDYYVEQVNKVLVDMPPVNELEEFLSKYQRREQPVSEDSSFQSHCKGRNG